MAITEKEVPGSGGASIEGVSPGTSPENSDEKTDEAPAGVGAETATTNPVRTATPPPPGGQVPPTMTVPDGGWNAWLQVACSFVIMVNTWGLINSFGVFQTYYETELLRGHSSSAISWVGSLQGALLLLLGVVAGPLFDAGNFRRLMVGGLFLIVFGMFMTSICKSYWQVVLAQGVCVGVGSGLLFLPAAAIISQYFARRRAFALGVQSVGSPLAGIVFPLIFSRLQPAVGFAWATRVIAFILLGLSAIPVAFMRTRVPPPARKRAFFEPQALRDRPYMLFNVAGFFAYVGLYVPYFYIQLFAIQHGIVAPGDAAAGSFSSSSSSSSSSSASASSSAYLVTVLNAGSILGRLLPNMAADRLGSVSMLAGTTFGAAVLALAWLGVRRLGGLVAFALLFGFFNGGVTSLPPSAIAVLAPDLSRLGTRMGMSFIFTGSAVLVGTPIAGAILRGYSAAAWNGLIAYSGATLMVGAVGFLAAQLIHVRRARAAKGQG
ncbi:hypothetical protein DL764_008720 [Monosporascus ibericus]|uniref:Major facilitator superfamily (MFS) profile domain-containing protein n=1 Tax=Monosporascus ibericus TaxID=155417 RepID=A0A4Q4SZ15_9PEZI|nr:hypothetical protein DL764_008720 [Monosporascus ibericus]